MTGPVIDKRDRLLVEALTALIDTRLSSSGRVLGRQASALADELVAAELATMRHDPQTGVFTLTMAGITITTQGLVYAALREWQSTARALIERRAA